MRKVFLAIPSYSGKLKQATQTSVACFNMEATSLGWSLQDFRWQNDSLIVHARNAIVGKFMESDCTDLFFLDDDVAVGPGVFTRLMSHPVDLVAAVYRLKRDDEVYAVNHISNDPTPDPVTELLEVGGCPFGMVRIKRAAIEAMVKSMESDWYMASCVKGLKTWPLFNTEVRDHVFYGEDIYFCNRFRAIGGKVWIDPEIPIQHISAEDKVFPGHYGHFLRKQKAVKEPALKAVA